MLLSLELLLRAVTTRLGGLTGGLLTSSPLPSTSSHLFFPLSFFDAPILSRILLDKLLPFDGFFKESILIVSFLIWVFNSAKRSFNYLSQGQCSFSMLKSGHSYYVKDISCKLLPSNIFWKFSRHTRLFFVTSLSFPSSNWSISIISRQDSMLNLCSLNDDLLTTSISRWLIFSKDTFSFWYFRLLGCLSLYLRTLSPRISRRAHSSWCALCEKLSY